VVTKRRKASNKRVRATAGAVPVTRAVGTAALAAEFVASGSRIRNDLQPPNRPAAYLYGRGLELLLKALLICGGTHDSRLRGLGHDLAATLREVRRHPGALRPVLSRTDHVLIGMINGMYSRKDFEYLFTGARRYPSLDAVDELCNRLVASLRPSIDVRVRGILKASKRRP
jgi:hypothetical protein